VHGGHPELARGLEVALEVVDEDELLRRHADPLRGDGVDLRRRLATPSSPEMTSTSKSWSKRRRS
jgi:hypothetical protein